MIATVIGSTSSASDADKARALAVEADAGRADAERQYANLFDDSTSEIASLERDVARAERERDAAKDDAAAAEEAARAKVEAELAPREQAVADQEAAVAAREAAVTRAEVERDQNTIGDGTWEVGVDIRPGKYKTAGGGATCYWAKLDRSGNIIDNDLFSGPSTIMIESGVFTFESQRCGEWTRVG